MPTFLAGCAKNGAATLPGPTPENPFFAWFGVDEAMLRRVVADKDGGIIAVTLMSSDTGKLYAALSKVIDKRR